MCNKNNSLGYPKTTGELRVWAMTKVIAGVSTVSMNNVDNLVKMAATIEEYVNSDGSIRKNDKTVDDAQVDVLKTLNSGLKDLLSQVGDMMKAPSTPTANWSANINNAFLEGVAMGLQDIFNGEGCQCQCNSDAAPTTEAPKCKRSRKAKVEPTENVVEPATTTTATTDAETKIED